MKVTYFHRRPQDGQVSIERVFAEVRDRLPPSIQPRVAESTFPSRGFWPRVGNLLEALFRQGDVNHITGDVHYLAMFLRRKKTLLTIHDCVSLERLSGMRRRLLFFFWYWLPARRSAMISVISQSAKTELLRHLKCAPQQIRVIYNPCPGKFHAAPKSFDAENPVILHVGTGANKNLLRTAEALRGIPCRLRIIGKLGGDQIRCLERCGIQYSAAAGLSDDEMVQEYRCCDMVVFVSTYEGFGMPIIEAQATGRPVVTSNILSMPEVAGGAACLADPFDVRSIRKAIVRVIEDADFRRAMVERGYQNVKRFEADRIAGQYVKLYQELHRAA